MIISLIGYMGSGKSHVSKFLSKHLNFDLIDLDNAISLEEKREISEIFKKSGEIYFRKVEKQMLEKIVNSDKNIVLSLGGGTPVYYDNINTINEKTISVYLRAKIGTLAERLASNKAKRPLIAQLEDEELPEFIAKHLFERNAYYNQAQIIIDTDNKTPEEIVKEITEKIY